MSEIVVFYSVLFILSLHLPKLPFKTCFTSLAHLDFTSLYEACNGVLRMQDICYFTSRDMGYYVQYFCQLSGIWGI